VDPATPDGTMVANAASAGATTPDPNALNNASTTTTQVIVIAARASDPTPSGSIPDTGAVTATGVASPVKVLLALGLSFVLLAALASASVLRRRRSTGPRTGR